MVTSPVTPEELLTRAAIREIHVIRQALYDADKARAKKAILNCAGLLDDLTRLVDQLN